MNKLTFGFIAMLAAFGAHAADYVDTVPNLTGEPVDILVDSGRTADCTNDSVFTDTGPSPFDVGSHTTRPACRAEVTVFARDFAMHMVEKVDWSPTDTTISMTLADRHVLKVAVWIVVPTTLAFETNAAAVAHLIDVDRIFTNNKAGIDVIGDYTVTTVPMTAAAGDVIQQALIDYDDGVIDNEDVILGIIGTTHYDPGRLNIYYLDTSLRGFHIRDPRTSANQFTAHSGNIILIGRGSKADTLAHEIGHALSLLHVNLDNGNCVDYTLTGAPCAYTLANIMWGGGFNRDAMTLGQAFRVNVNETSILNTGHYRPAGSPIRACYDWRIDWLCPYLGLNP